MAIRTTPSWTRRRFLQATFTAGGGLLVSGSFLACSSDDDAGSTTTASPNPTTGVAGEPFEPNLFVRIDADGSVTLTLHRSEMGQGVRTSLAMLLAEELEVDLDRVRVQHADANEAIGSQITSGSGSIADNYDLLREAGATAREMLLAAGAQTWGVPVSEVRAEGGAVVRTSTGERLDYGELVAAARDVEPPASVTLKDPSDFRLIGTSVPRIEASAIVSGTTTYGIDVRVPGMLFAAVARSPVPGGTVASVDDTAARRVAGVRDVVEVTGGVAAVADNTWAAMQGRDALEITWDEGPNASLSSASIRASLADLLASTIASGHTDAPNGIEAVYETPYVAHAPMEPPSCVADATGATCEIWAPTQNPLDVQTFVNERVGLPTTVHVTHVGGGFGRRLEVDFAMEAAEVSKAAGVPVQVVWTRTDDLQHDFYRQPTYHWLRAGWADTSALQQWRHYLAAPGLNGIAYREGRDVLLTGLEIPYAVPDKQSLPTLADVPLPTGPWRGVMSGPNAFAIECFLDEVATAMQRDPFELRQQLLPEGDRLRGVLERAATAAGWGSQPPAGASGASGPATGRGIACHTYHDTPVAMVADVSVTDGDVKVDKVVCAVDCGTVVHPDMVVQQMEGGIAFALTSLFAAEITFDAGRVQETNFDDFPVLQLHQMPEVEVHLVPSTAAPTGAGEMGVPPTVPAVVNAIFAATGVRIRHLPLRPGDLVQ